MSLYSSAHTFYDVSDGFDIRTDRVRHTIQCQAECSRAFDCDGEVCVCNNHDGCDVIYLVRTNQSIH
jgi:hypothetical protein